MERAPFSRLRPWWSNPEKAERLLKKLGVWHDGPHDLEDFLEMHFPDTPSLVGNKLVIPSGLTLFGGGSKIGKSHLAMQLTLNRAVGEPWLGFPTTPGRTLYINAEIMAPQFQDRFEELLAERHRPPRKTIYIQNVLGLNAYINTQDGKRLIEKSIEKVQPDLTILDPLSHLLLGEEIKQAELQKFFHVLAEWRLKYNTAILLIHHYRKRQRDNRGRHLPATIQDFSGHGLLLREPDAIIGLDGEPDGDTVNLLFGLRHADPPARFRIKRGSDLWWRRMEGLIIPTNLVPPLKLLLNGGLSWANWRDGIMEVEGCHERTARRRKVAAQEKGFVIEVNGHYELTPEARKTLLGNSRQHLD